MKRTNFVTFFSMILALSLYFHNVKSEALLERLAAPFIGEWEAIFMDLPNAPFISKETDKKKSPAKGVKITFCVRYGFDNAIGGVFVKGNTDITAKIFPTTIYKENIEGQVIRGLEFFFDDLPYRQVYTNIEIKGNSLVGTSGEPFIEKSLLKMQLINTNKAVIKFYDRIGKKNVKFKVNFITRTIFQC